jgi:Fibronectin type III domain
MRTPGTLEAAGAWTGGTVALVHRCIQAIPLSLPGLTRQSSRASAVRPAGGALIKSGRDKRSESSVCIGALAVAVSLAAGSSVARGEEMPFEHARIFLEFNSTAEDLGVQAFLSGEAWQEVQIIAPDGQILQVAGAGNLGKRGLIELFFESEEPSLDDLPLEQSLAQFPEGEYQFRGKTVEGDTLVSTATLSHEIPGGPRIVAPEEDAAVDPDDAVISWEPVTEPEGIEIVGYQVIVEQDESARGFEVDLPATATRVSVPPDFLEPGTEYKLEVLAIAASGNQTITESSFATADE